MSMDKYVISIDKKRLDKFENMMPNMSFTAFRGVDKNKLFKRKKDISTNFCNSICTTSIVGCASSHILLWKHILRTKNNKTIFLICEDDTYVDEITFKSKEEYIIEFLKENPMCFFQLTGEGAFFIKNTSIGNLEYNEYKYHLFLGSYCVTYEYLERLVEYFLRTKIFYHIDLSMTLYNNQNNIKQVIISPQIAHQIKSIGGPFDQLIYSLEYPIFLSNHVIINNIFILVVIFSIFLINTRCSLYYIIAGYILYHFVKFDAL